MMIWLCYKEIVLLYYNANNPIIKYMDYNRGYYE